MGSERSILWRPGCGDCPPWGAEPQPSASRSANNAVARCLLLSPLVRLLVIALTLGIAACSARPLSTTSVPSPQNHVAVPLHLVVGTNRRGPVVTPEVLGQWVGQAAEDFAAAGFSFEVASVRYVEAGSIDARTRRGRRGLAELGEGDGVHIAIAGPLRRPRKRPSTRGSWLPRQRVIVLSTEANRTTLSHELGHAFGLGHERAMKNLMCSCDRDPQARFSAMQLTQAATAAARWQR